mmetsp:Transcript_14722/g.57793  ORF Transcript_14722/g.57793 Transcript_14722/m.57793 type:complete len:252 (+) Transcript_14722:2698-3453(+)
MPPPPSSNTARFAADIMVGSAEMPSGSDAGESVPAAGSEPSIWESCPDRMSAAIAAVNLSFTLISSLPAGFLPPRLLSNLARLASWRSTSAARSARTSASRAPITSRIRSNLRGTKVPPPRSPVMYPPSEGSRSRYVLNSVFSAPSAMSSVGSGGRKSFPTSMHSSTKSSTIRSQSYSNGRASATTLNSWSRYSLSNPTCSRRNPSSVGFCSTSRLGWPRSPPPNLTTSRSRQKCGSWVTSASMMRSASRP